MLIFIGKCEFWPKFMVFPENLLLTKFQTFLGTTSKSYFDQINHFFEKWFPKEFILRMERTFWWGTFVIHFVKAHMKNHIYYSKNNSLTIFYCTFLRPWPTSTTLIPYWYFFHNVVKANKSPKWVISRKWGHFRVELWSRIKYGL